MRLMLAKKQFFVMAVMVFHLWCAYAEEGVREEFYNYYHRNSDGTFVLEQINVSETGVVLFLYKAGYDKRNRISSVTGYYYQSDDVKFVDTIANNRVVKTEYFNRFNPSVYTRTNSYRVDGFMNSIAITHEYNGDSGKETNRIWIFFEIDPLGMNYDYYAIRVQESDYGLSGATIIDIPGASATWGDVISSYMVSEGKVNRKYQPLLVMSKLIVRTKKLLVPVSSSIVESYRYDVKGNTAGYMLLAKNGGMLREIERNTIDGAIVKRTKRSVPTGVMMISGLGLDDHFFELRIQKDNYELYAVGDLEDEKIKSLDLKKINMKALAEELHARVKRIDYIKDDLYIEYRIDRTADWKETGEYTIFCNDERVEFKPGVQTPKSTLALDFDVYPDNWIFANQYPDSLTSPEKRFEIDMSGLSDMGVILVP
jgi:hypothetical protein